MLQIAWNSREIVRAEPCEPQYSPILDKVVEADLLEVRHVDDGGRMGAWVPDPHGNPLWIPVDTKPTDLRYCLPRPGRYAVIARDHRGRHLGRNDVFARESGQPDPWRQPTGHERLQQALARERERRQAAEESADTERTGRLEAETSVRQLTAERDRLRQELQREQARARQHERAEAAERKHREQLEAQLAADKKREPERAKPSFTAKDLVTAAMWVVMTAYYLRRRFDRAGQTEAPRSGEEDDEGRAKPGPMRQPDDGDESGPMARGP